MAASATESGPPTPTHSTPHRHTALPYHSPTTPGRTAEAPRPPWACGDSGSTSNSTAIALWCTRRCACWWTPTTAGTASAATSTPTDRAEASGSAWPRPASAATSPLHLPRRAPEARLHDWVKQQSNERQMAPDRQPCPDKGTPPPGV